MNALCESYLRGVLRGGAEEVQARVPALGHPFGLQAQGALRQAQRHEEKETGRRPKKGPQEGKALPLAVGRPGSPLS